MTDTQTRLRRTIDARLAVLMLYGLWLCSTYLLEGRPGTLLRPDAHTLRLIYTVVANVLLGTVASILLLRRLILTGDVSVRSAGFAAPCRALICAVLGLALGWLLYIAQGPPSMHPMVIINGFAQVLPVSIAEVLVCWSLVGVVAASVPVGFGRVAQSLTTTMVASVAFGVYHIAHSAPFNSPAMIALLTVVGVLTSVVFVAVRDVYGTIAFHNFLAVFGVLRALAATDALEKYAAANTSLLVTSVVALGVLILMHRTLIRQPAAPRAALRDTTRP